MIPATREPQAATRPVQAIHNYQTFTGLDKPLRAWRAGRYWYIHYGRKLGPFLSYGEMRWNLAEIMVAFVLGEDR